MTKEHVSECHRNESQDDDHLQDVPDGAGCTEIWEHLSDRRDEEDEEPEE
ncbi:hypothetical protein [Haladaptatus sp. AB643]|nr:hypothetical protein [Haladaptatus sp. AB643]MCO8246500.1 hypothetical protein [Haladaptatus sp. AB643]